MRKEAHRKGGVLPPCLCLFLLISASTALGFEFEIRPLLQRYCIDCHNDERSKGSVNFANTLTSADADKYYELWPRVTEVLRHGEMPPKDKPQPTNEERQKILTWIESWSKAPIIARPGPSKPRRLSAPEYRNTLHSLFGFDLEVNIASAEQTISEKSLVLKLLPTDPPGASGFINDTHGAKLSTTLWDQYAYLADLAIEEYFSSRSPRTLTEAHQHLERFATRAFRRPLPHEARARLQRALETLEGTALIGTMKREMKALLMSPAFLYRGLLMETKAEGPVDDFELAERLSYFLWEDMPDDELLEVAESGTLTDSGIYASQINRMLASPKARRLAESFGSQWLALTEIDESQKDANLRRSLKSQPLDFLHYLFTENRPLLELIDSKVAFANHFTAGYYGEDRRQMKKHIKPKGIERQMALNQRIVLERAQGRGGLLTMPGILAMNRGPILRGTWMLRSILGETLPEPPADIPPVKPNPPGEKLSFRERFEQHRSDAACARCHDKIDPLGFALEAYDEKGKYAFASADLQRRKKRKPSETTRRHIDTSGRLPSGETFANFAELKALLLTSQRKPIVRNIVERTLAYALCRKLERYDQPTVDDITEKLYETNGTWQDLFHEVANSLPFRKTSSESSL